MKKTYVIAFFTLSVVSCGTKKTPVQIDVDELCSLHERLDKIDAEKKKDAAKIKEFNTIRYMIDKKIMGCYKKYEKNASELKEFQAGLKNCPY